MSATHCFPVVMGILAAILAQTALADDPKAPRAPSIRLSELVGTSEIAFIDPGETLLDLAERHRLGFERVARLNPDIDPWIPAPGSRVRLPTLHVLPDAPHEGLVVNLPELQLYDFGRPGSGSPRSGGGRSRREEPEVIAIAIGDELDPSLVGEFVVGRKRANPVWHVPESIRAERPELPAAVPPGPDNPLGPYWLTIGRTSYGIHGTNNRWSIGREATHGCLRLYNDVVERLYARTPSGTPIRILYQTVKLGQRDGILYVEAHPDRYRRDPDRRERARAIVAGLGIDDLETLQLLDATIAAGQGDPVALAAVPDDLDLD